MREGSGRYGLRKERGAIRCRLHVLRWWLLALREVEQRLAIASRLAACIRDLRDPSRVVHGLDEIIRTRMLMIAAGYEDGNDVDTLRRDPMFKLAKGRLPDDGDLCSQPTISRLENLPDARALLRMGRAMIDHYCQSFRQVPRRIVLDIDDTFEAVHGGQQLRLFNAHHDEYGFQPIVVFDSDGRMIAAVLRPASRPSGKQIVRWLHRLVTAIRGHWPRVEIMLRADSHYCTPEVLRFCRARRLDYTLGVAPPQPFHVLTHMEASAAPPTSTLRKHVLGLEESTAARAATAADGMKLRRFKEFHDAAGSWAEPVKVPLAKPVEYRRRAVWSASSLALKPDRRGPTRASSSPVSANHPAGPSIKTSTAHAARRRTTSRHGRRIWLPIAHPAAGPAPTSYACSCMSALIG